MEPPQKDCWVYLDIGRSRPVLKCGEPPTYADGQPGVGSRFQRRIAGVWHSVAVRGLPAPSRQRPWATAAVPSAFPVEGIRCPALESPGSFPAERGLKSYCSGSRNRASTVDSRVAPRIRRRRRSQSPPHPRSRRIGHAWRRKIHARRRRIQAGPPGRIAHGTTGSQRLLRSRVVAWSGSASVKSIKSTLKLD